VWWYLAGAAAVIFGLFFYQLFGPNPAIVVSKETTYITEPLRADGLPDYEKYILERLREGVTPENNAAVLLLQAMPHEGMSRQEFELVAQEIGLSREDWNATKLAPVYGDDNRARVIEWWRGFVDGMKGQKSAADTNQTSDESAPNEQAAKSPYRTEDDVAYRLIGEASLRPWTTAQCPPLAEWIAENQEQLDLIVEAGKRPRLYIPSVTLLDSEWQPVSLAVPLVGIELMREAMRCLSVRAMWHVGEKRFDPAWQDVRAIHGLARSFSRSPSLTEQMVGLAMEGVAEDLIITLLHEGRPSVAQALEVQREFARFGGFAMLSSTFAIERISGLSMLVDSQSGGAGAIFSQTGSLLRTGDDDEFFSNLLNRVSMDWNVALRDWNSWWDRIAAAVEISDANTQEAAFAQIEADLAKVDDRLARKSEWVGAIFSRPARSNLVSHAVARLFTPGITQARFTEERANASLELLRVATALAVHRARHGNYPESLKELVPEVLTELPVDALTGARYIYKHDGAGYLLYDLGKDGSDDSGSNIAYRIFEGRQLDDYHYTENEAMLKRIPPDADDTPSIRVPRPAFQLPK
jgi:hypothetical protein